MDNFCGIDFGTSNSTLGCCVENQTKLINFENKSPTLPSAIFYEFDENKTVFGTKALNYYVEGYHGRLLRSFKSVLGTQLMNDYTQIRNARKTFINIIEDFLRYMKENAEKQQQCHLDSVVLGRPIHFIDDNPTQDIKAQHALEQAAKNVGFKHVEFQFEPIAASLKYEQSLSSEKIVLIVDIGGGTTDISVVRLSPERAKKIDRKDDCLANTGIHIGGTDFDKNLNLNNVMPHLGYKQPLKNGRIMPNHFYSDMTTWHRINQVYKQEFKLAVNSMRGDLQNPQHFTNLQKVVHEKLAFLIAMNVEQAKIDLSKTTELTQNFSFLEDNLHIKFTKSDLESTLVDKLDQIDKKISECILSAELNEKQIDAVFLTGGSSKMQIIKEFISNKFASIPVNNQDSLSSVGIGLTLDAKRKFLKA